MTTETLPLPSAYKHQLDIRSNMEKLLSDELVQKITEQNLERIRENIDNSASYHCQHSYFFICLTGLPPFEN
jgi:hypothetical protein